MGDVKTIHGEPFDPGPDAGMPEEIVRAITRVMDQTTHKCKLALIITVELDHVHASLINGDNTTIQHARNMLAELEIQRQDIVRTMFPRPSSRPLKPKEGDEEDTNDDDEA